MCWFRLKNRCILDSLMALPRDIGDQLMCLDSPAGGDVLGRELSINAFLAAAMLFVSRCGDSIESPFPRRVVITVIVITIVITL